MKRISLMTALLISSCATSSPEPTPEPEAIAEDASAFERAETWAERHPGEVSVVVHEGEIFVDGRRAGALPKQAPSLLHEELLGELEALEPGDERGCLVAGPPQLSYHQLTALVYTCGQSGRPVAGLGEARTRDGAQGLEIDLRRRVTIAPALSRSPGQPVVLIEPRGISLSVDSRRSPAFPGCPADGPSLCLTEGGEQDLARLGEWLQSIHARRPGEPLHLSIVAETDTALSQVVEVAEQGEPMVEAVTLAIAVGGGGDDAAGSKSPPDSTDEGLGLRDSEHPGDFCDKDNIREVVSQHSDALQACFSEALKRSPELQGRWDWLWIIELDGSVSRTRLKNRPEASDQRVESCIQDVIEGFVFERPQGGICVIQYPFVLN